jgi:hypothetical protein
MTDLLSPAVAPTGRLAPVRTRLAGVGALAFVATVIAQNAIRGSSAPGNGSSTEDVMTHYADHPQITSVLVVLFTVGGIGLSVFLGGAMRRLLDTPRRAWALTGFVGAVGIIGLFSLLVASEQAVTIVAGHDHPSTGAVEALWALHNSIFTVLLLMISIALLGLSRASVAAGITPRAFEWLGPVGSALLLVGAVSGPAIAAGDAMPLFGISVLGFAVWVGFLATTGYRLVRAAS